MDNEVGVALGDGVECGNEAQHHVTFAHVDAEFVAAGVGPKPNMGVADMGYGERQGALSLRQRPLHVHDIRLGIEVVRLNLCESQ